MPEPLPDNWASDWYWYWLGQRQKQFIELNGSLGEPVADDFDQYPYIPLEKREAFIKRTRFPICIKNRRYVSMRKTRNGYVIV